jgi:hypothetical protein
MITFEQVAFGIPFIFLTAGWVTFWRRGPMAKVWASGIATLISLPVGSYLVERVVLPPSWAPNYGDHSPGAGLAFFPLLAGWVLCVITWLLIAGANIALAFWRRNSN